MAKNKRNVSQEVREKRRERMLAYHARKKGMVVKPTEVQSGEIKELSGISEPRNVQVFIKNPITINGISYGGMCNVPSDQAQDLQYRSDMVDWRRKKEQDSTNHVNE